MNNATEPRYHEMATVEAVIEMAAAYGVTPTVTGSGATVRIGRDYFWAVSK